LTSPVRFICREADLAKLIWAYWAGLEVKNSKTKKLNLEAQNRNPGATFRVTVTVVVVLPAAAVAGIAAELLEVIILLVSFFISL
jgi:hypothetical protein